MESTGGVQASDISPVRVPAIAPSLIELVVEKTDLQRMVLEPREGGAREGEPVPAVTGRGTSPPQDAKMVTDVALKALLGLGG